MLSKRTQLCTDVLATIGSAPRGALVTAHALADKLSISVSHMESILRLLREAGFVRSARGPGGGYCLACHPDQISIWSVVRAVETPEESLVPRSNCPNLTDSLEDLLDQAAKRYLCTRTIGEFVKTDLKWDTRHSGMRWAFGLGPKP
ncbi:MAG: RrF2 family transcriptional regulator, partial [Betaproteobacteria bacterium]